MVLKVHRNHIAREADGSTSVSVILLRQIHSSTDVVTLFNVCLHFFLSFYCIAHVYNTVSFVSKMPRVISGVCVCVCVCVCV